MNTADIVTVGYLEGWTVDCRLPPAGGRLPCAFLYDSVGSAQLRQLPSVFLHLQQPAGPHALYRVHVAKRCGSA